MKYAVFVASLMKKKLKYGSVYYVTLYGCTTTRKISEKDLGF
jgi:hypothetical protein